MPINAPVIVSVVEVGSPVAYLRVTWDHDITGSPTTDGYLIEWDYDNPAWNPSWIVPPAVDLGLLAGNGATPVRRYTVLINLSNAFVSDWETFEEYAEGERGVLAYGGSKWAGPAVAIETDIGYKGFGDDFESYAVGQHSELGAGKGWAAPAEAIGMGDFDIVKRTIGGVDDQRVVVDNSKSPWVRTMAIGDDWTSLRIGVRLTSINRPAPIPYLYIGVCNGSDSPPGVAGTRHFYGFRGGTDAISYASPHDTLLITNSGSTKECWIRNGVESVHSYNLQSVAISANLSDNGSVVVLNITKGSPWSLNLWSVESQSSATRFQTIEQFHSIMNALSTPSGYTSMTSNGLTPDEVTYGALDTICFSFLGSTDGFEISDIDYARLS